MKYEITNKPTADGLKEVFLAAQSHASDHLQRVQHWENLILAANGSEHNADKAKKTRSDITIKHVRKLLEWRYPVLEQAFLARNELFNPTGRDAMDAELAKAHKKILNYQMNNEMDKVTLIARMVRAYLNQGTAILHLGWKSEKGKPTYIVPQFEYDYISSTSRTYAILEERYVEILNILAEQPQAESSLPTHLVEGARYYDEHDRVVNVKITGFVEKESEEESLIYNQPVLTVVSIYDVFGAPECKTNLQDSPYIIYRYLAPIYELEENEEFDTDDINWESVHNINSGTESTLKSIYAQNDKRRQVEVFEYWGLHDIDGTGNIQSIRASWVDGHLLECIPNPYPDKKHPFYSAAYSPDSTLESFYGTSDAHLAEDNQNILSAMHRGIIDIHANSAYGQRGIAKNVLDPTNRAKFLKGENFEYDPNMVDPNALFHTFEFPSVNQSTMMYMQQINADSDALTGIKSFNEGISGNAFGNTAAGISGVLSATALRESSITGRLEDMLTKVGKRIMQLNVLYLDNNKIIQLAGVEGLAIKAATNPSIDIKLDITNQTEDAIKAQEISFMLQTLGQSMPPELVKATLMEVAELRNLDRFHNTLANFEMTPPEPSEDEKEIAALQKELLRAQIAATQGNANKANSDAQLTQVKAGTQEVETAKKQAETDKIGVETERMVTGQDTEDKIRIISAQGESNAAASLVKSNGIKGFNRIPQG